MHRFQNSSIQSDDDDIVCFDDLKKVLVKFFSDVFEALVASVFLSTGDIDLSQAFTLRLLKSKFITSIPSSEQARTKCILIYNSKKYCNRMRLHHQT